MSEHHSYSYYLKEYLKVGAILAALTVLTVVAALIPMPGHTGGIIHVAIGLIIAAVKVAFVMAIFMHLKFDNKYIRACVFVPVFFFFVLTFALNVLGP